MSDGMRSDVTKPHCKSEKLSGRFAGLSVDTYAYLERGQMPLGGDANPRLDTLLRIFDVLDVEPPRLPQLPSTADTRSANWHGQR